VRLIIKSWTQGIIKDWTIDFDGKKTVSICAPFKKDLKKKTLKPCWESRVFGWQGGASMKRGSFEINY